MFTNAYPLAHPNIGTFLLIQTSQIGVSYRPTTLPGERCSSTDSESTRRGVLLPWGQWQETFGVVFFGGETSSPQGSQVIYRLLFRNYTSCS
jgi:hypothetical protein